MMMTGWWWVIGAGLGLIAGSFLATLLLRWPEGRSVVAGRSACDACGAPLGARDLIPLLSFAVAGGRCRACGVRIDRLHPAIEIGCAAIGVVSLAVAPGWSGLAGMLLGWILLALALLDARHFWLPDALTLPLLVLGLLAGAIGIGPSLLDQAIGAAAGFAVLAAMRLLYRSARGRDGLGGGDPKLLGAIGAWVGWQTLPLILITACCVGFGMIGWRVMTGRRVRASDRLPFGTMMAVAGFAWWLIIAEVGFPPGGGPIALARLIAALS